MSLDRNDGKPDKKDPFQVPDSLAGGLLKDGGALMVRNSGFKSLCLVALLVAEAIQAITPDIASLASTRLPRIIQALAERGESHVSRSLLVCFHFDRQKSLPAHGSVPSEDRNQESAPDEVCTACSSRICELPGGEADNSTWMKHAAFNACVLSAQADWLEFSTARDTILSSCDLIHSLCRMTC